MGKAFHPKPRPRRLALAVGGPLWHHPDFLKFWAGQSISRLGTRVTVLALPTAAIQLLGAGPIQVGTLAALQYLPFLILGLPVGIIADRLPRRPVMIACDIGRLTALSSLPVAYLLGVLSIGHIYAVSLLIGICTVFFDVAYQSYLPVLIERSELMEANAKLEVTNAAAAVAGPAIGGALIQLVKAAPAILLDAASYVVSVMSLLSIRTTEPPSSRSSKRGQGTFRRELAQGLRSVFGNPTIRLIAGCSATANLGGQMVQAVYLIYSYNELKLTPAAIGVILGIGSLGSLLGALAVYPMARRIGVGPTLAVSIFVGHASLWLIPLARTGFAAPVLAIASFVFNFNTPIYNINTVTVRQAIVPNHLQGRVVGTVRTLVIGAIPVGAALGGLLGSRIGLMPTLVVGAAVGTLSVVWILAGPVRIRQLGLDAG